MRFGVDAFGSAREHRNSGMRQVGGKLPREGHAFRGGVPRTHDRHARPARKFTPDDEALGWDSQVRKPGRKRGTQQNHGWN